MFLRTKQIVGPAVAALSQRMHELYQEISAFVSKVSLCVLHKAGSKNPKTNTKPPSVSMNSRKNTSHSQEPKTISASPFV